MRQRILTALLFVFGILIAGAQTNTLSVPAMKAPAGKTISLPVNLDNTEDIVAVQFTLTLPNGLWLQPEAAALTDRAEGLGLRFKEVATHQYLAVIYSPDNTPIRGRTGAILNVPLTLAADLADRSVHKINLTDVILGVSGGANVVTGINPGEVTIATSPDLVVSDVTTDATSVAPLQDISVSWKVSNIGGMATNSGWSETIYLEKDNKQYKFLTTVYYPDPLGMEAMVSRNIDLKIPEILGLDGDARVVVSVNPNADAGEPTWMRDNNTASSTSYVNVEKRLSLTPATILRDESKGGGSRFYLTRSGDNSADETYDIAYSGDSRISIPSSVTIAKGKSGAYINFTVHRNNVLDDIYNFPIGISGNGYDPVQAEIVLEDDTDPALYLEAENDEVMEGESLKFTIRAQRAPKEDLKITLRTNLTNRFDIPEITLPAGQTETEVTVVAKENTTPDITQIVTFTVSAAGYISASEMIDLLDNDVPTLQLSLSPDAVSEADGPIAVVATLTRTDNIDKTVTVKFTDDSNGGIYYGKKSVEMKPGVEKVTFNLGPIDNNIVDGERTYNITAAVWIASCSCNANNVASGGTVTVPLTVYDNDGPTLTLKTSASVVQEGGEMELTVERNTNTSAPLEVRVTTDHDSGLEYPATVTIPAGASSATFKIKSIENDVNGDSFTALVTVESDGHAKANAWFMVSDTTLPDAQIPAITVSEAEVEVGESVVVTATVKNTGCYELPAMTKVGFYIDSESKAVATAYLQNALPAGESVEVSKEISLPDAVGTYQIYAVANDGQAVQESVYTNNRSVNAEVKTLSPFRVTLSTDKDTYKQGESVSLTGHIAGKNVANKAIDVYLINDGYRHVESTTTDANGDFTLTYTPYANQMGHFVAGACYPKDNVTDEYAAFDVCGIKRIDNSQITCEAYLGKDYERSYSIRNFGPLAATGVVVTVESKPDNCEVEVTCPQTIAAGGDAEISFKIIPSAQSTGRNWEHIVLSLTSNEGSTMKTSLNYYCYIEHGNIQASINKIDATMIKGKGREYPVTLTNTGKGETGKITLSMPSWMSTVTPREIPSIPSGETTDVVLLFNYNEDMQLNVARTGSIVFNCENANGLTMPFVVVPVSEEKGTMVVDVTDNYTYYTEEAPHVAGANVAFKDPYTNRVVASGTSDENGLYTIELPEGYYALSVTAEGHNSFSDNVYVNAGRRDKTTVTLPIETIKIDWKVEETEVEDEYKIETIVKYETNVPAPVVKIVMPKRIDGDNMAIGESMIINMNLTNVGLIKASNNTLRLPSNLTEFTFEALSHNEPFDLAPQQSVNVPIRITKVDPQKNARPKDVGTDMANNFKDCMAGLAVRYEYLCGEKLSANESAENMALKFCAIGSIIAAIIPDTGGGGGSGPGWNGTGGGGSYYESTGGVTSGGICDHCEAKKAEKLIDILVGHTYLSDINDAINNTIERYREGNNTTDLKFVVKKAGEEVKESIRDKILDEIHDGLGDIAGYAIDVYEYVHVCDPPKEDDDDSGSHTSASGESHGGGGGHFAAGKNPKASSHSITTLFDSVALLLIDQLDATEELLLMTYGDRVWYSEMDAEKLAFLDYALALPDGYMPTDAELAAIKPASATIEQMQAYIRHINGEGENFPTPERIAEQVNSYDSIDAQAKELGYGSMLNYYGETLGEFKSYIDSKMSDESVCASITLKLSQRMTMTRQAFKGTLTVFNGHDNTAMTDVRLDLDVRDNLGNQVTSRQMQINADSLNGFEGEVALNSGWSLGAQETGVAEIMFIPTKYAAPTEPVEYSFGGTLTYIDPFNGYEVTRKLYPVTLTVNPSPELDLTYFMQRDVIGDDPLTPEIEACEEAEFSLLINNIGYGDAKNVRMVTDQPEIIDNEKGLMIDFELMSSQLNGGEKTLALGSSVATDFGIIPSKSTIYAQWWLKCSLLGHFTDYNVEATHVTSFDNPDLSLLNNVTIHELIRSIDVTAGEETLKGFMTNDIPDKDDAPDMLYLSNGEIEPVAIASSSNIVKRSATEYALTVTRQEEGWNYGNITDPTYGVVKLMGVTRQSDGATMSVRNFWQTDRTLRDGKDPLYENRIHFVDNFTGAASETYILTFEPMPELLLDVVAFEGVPEEDTVAKAQPEEIKVVFNKYIDPATFTTDDITIAVQGTNMDVSDVVISTEDNKTFTLNLSTFNQSAGNGYYVLTVKTTGITDSEGFTGKSGKQATWVMYVDGLMLINTFVEPKYAGKINGNKNVEYGETVALTAEANEGYTFSHWTVDGLEASREPEWSAVVVNDMTVIANFTTKKYEVRVDDAVEGGKIVGHGTGIYPYYDHLTFDNVPDADYEFEYWIVNGENVTTPKLSVNVTGEIQISAVFKYVGKHYQQLTLYSGWNWISHSLSSVHIDDMMANRNISRIVSRDSESVRDAENGVIGDIEQLLPHSSYKLHSRFMAPVEFGGHSFWEASTPIAVNSGWNWIGYPVSIEMPVEEALSLTNADTLDAIVGQEGFAQYDGENWIGTLETLRPGAGYMYHSRSAKNITYNVSGNEAASVKSATYSFGGSPLAVDIRKYKSVMPMVATVVDVDGSDTDNAEFNLAAFCGSECRGIGSLVNGKFMMNVYGNDNDEITFVVTDATGEKEYPATGSISFAENLVGNVQTPHSIMVNLSTGIKDARYDGNIKVYVDGDMLRIKGIPAEQIDLVEIYDISGAKLILENNVSESGVRISSLVKGVYVVLVKGNGQYTYHKIKID